MGKHLVSGSIIIRFDAEVDDPSISTPKQLADAMGVYFPNLYSHLMNEDTVDVLIYDFQPEVIIHGVRDGDLDSIDEPEVMVDTQGDGNLEPVFLGVQNSEGAYSWQKA